MIPVSRLAPADAAVGASVVHVVVLVAVAVGAVAAGVALVVEVKLEPRENVPHVLDHSLHLKEGLVDRLEDLNGAGLDTGEMPDTVPDSGDCDDPGLNGGCQILRQNPREYGDAGHVRRR